MLLWQGRIDFFLHGNWIYEHFFFLYKILRNLVHNGEQQWQFMLEGSRLVYVQLFCHISVSSYLERWEMKIVGRIITEIELKISKPVG